MKKTLALSCLVAAFVIIVAIAPGCGQSTGMRSDMDSRSIPIADEPNALNCEPQVYSDGKQFYAMQADLASEKADGRVDAKPNERQRLEEPKPK